MRFIMEKIYRAFSVILLFFLLLLLHSSAFADDWYVETVESEGYAGGDLALAIDSSDRPHIAYIDRTPDDVMMHAVYNGSDWELSLVGDCREMTSVYTSIAIDSADNPHIAYAGPYPYPLMYAHRDGSNWTIETVDDVQALNISMALDNNGSPHFAYCEYDSGSYSYDFKYARWDGSTWEIQLLEDLGNSATRTAIDIDSLNNPYIVFNRNNPDMLWSAYWDGSTWQFSEITYCDNDNISVILDSNDYPRLVHSDSSGDFIAYTYWNGSGWETDLVEENGGKHSGFALSPMEGPHISYEYFDALRCAFYDGSQWVIETVDDSPSVGFYSSIGVDSTSIPHIAYHDDNWQDLKYARRLSSDVEDGDTGNNPVTYKLYPAYPNPSKGRATISFSLPLAADIELAVYDIKGRKVETVASGHYSAGEHEAEVNGLTAGIYIYRLEADDFADTKKMVVVE